MSSATFPVETFAWADYVAEVYHVGHYLGNHEVIPADQLEAERAKFEIMWAQAGKDLAKFKEMLSTGPTVKTPEPKVAGNEQPDAVFRYAVGIPFILLIGYGLYRLMKVGMA